MIQLRRPSITFAWSMGAMILSAVLHVCALPSSPTAVTAWIFTLPLVVLFLQDRFPVSVLWGYGAGILSWGWILMWLRHVTWGGWILLSIILGIFFGLWFHVAHKSLKNILQKGGFSSICGLLALAGAWTGLEVLRGTIFTGFPWLPLASSQIQSPIFLSALPWIGAYGLSGLLIFINLLFVRYAYSMREAAAVDGLPKSPLRLMRGEFWLFIAIFGTLFYAFSKDIGGLEEAPDEFDVGIVQPYTPALLKWDSMHARSQYRVLETLTESFEKESLTAIIWPEAATPSAIVGQYQVQDWAEELSTRIGIPIWMGNIAREGDNSYNICTVVDPYKGLQFPYYAKRRRVPFGEYVPLRNWWPWVEKFVPVGFDLTVGTEAAGVTVDIKGKPHHMGCLICYEDIFPDLAIDSVHAGAEFFLVVTNGAWYGEEDQALQHFAHSILRAREVARTFIRCGNAGASGWIDPMGTVHEILTKPHHGLYFRGTGQLKIKMWQKFQGRETFYVKTNGLLPWLIGLCSILYLMQIFWRKLMSHFFMGMMGLCIFCSFMNPSLEAAESFQGAYLRGQSALQAGLPHLAKREFDSLANDLSLDESLKLKVLQGQIDAAIACEDFNEAHVLLGSWEGPLTPSYHLLQALVAYGKGDWEVLAKELSDCAFAQLEDRERPWAYLLKGLSEMHENRPMAAEELLKQARDAAIGAPQESWIETIILEYKVRYGVVDDQILKDFENKLSKYRFKAADERLVEAYALALATAGRDNEAIGVLEKALKKTPSWNDTTQSRLYFLMGLLGKNSPKSIAAFQRLVMGSYPIKFRRNALHRLAVGQPVEEFERWLNQVMNGVQNMEPLLADCLFLRASIFLSKGELDKAIEDAQWVFINSPALKIHALEILASVSWLKTQYKSAADYLLQWRALVLNNSMQANLSGWIGDAYFMAQDWALAAKFYREALTFADESQKGRLLLQCVMSEIKDGKWQETSQLLVNYPADRPDFLKPHWIFIQHLQESGKPNIALEKMHSNHLIELAIYPLKCDLMLLEGRCFLEDNQPIEALRTARNINKIFEEDADKIEASFRAQGLLLEAEILLILGDVGAAGVLLNNLRVDYSATKAAEISYLIEGRSQAKQGKIVNAQQTLMEFVKLYSKSEFAPIALFEAGLLSSNRGLMESTQQALKLFEQIVQDYPESDLILPARLEQGKLLCELGDFEAALILYGSLQVTDDKQEWNLLQMAKGNCFLAQLPEKAAIAIDTFERLLDRPSLTKAERSEAQYKLGYIFFKTDKLAKAEKIYWQFIEPILVSAEPLPPQLDYWISRSTLDLGEIFEQRLEWTEACHLYEIFLKRGLPGTELIRNRLEKILSSFN